MRFPSGPIVYEFHLSYQIFYQKLSNILSDRKGKGLVNQTDYYTLGIGFLLFFMVEMEYMALHCIKNHFPTASFLKKVYTPVQDQAA